MIFIFLILAIVVFAGGYVVGAAMTERQYADRQKEAKLLDQIRQLEVTVDRLRFGPDEFQRKLDREVAKDVVRIRE